MEEKRDSFIFYRSFYESLINLKQSDRAKVYDAICGLALNQKEADLSGIPLAIFTLIKPQLEANNKKFINGCKPKTNQKGSKTEAKIKQNGSKTEGNVNDNVNVECRMSNVNDNVNENIKDTVIKKEGLTESEKIEQELERQENWIDEVDLFDTFESEFARPITQVEVTRLGEWTIEYDKKLIYYALRESRIYDKKSFDYIQKILWEWKEKGFTSQDIENNKHHEREDFK